MSYHFTFFLNGVLKFETLCPILLLCSTRVQGHCGRWVKMGEGRFLLQFRDDGGMMGDGLMGHNLFRNLDEAPIPTSYA